MLRFVIVALALTLACSAPTPTLLPTPTPLPTPTATPLPTPTPTPLPTPTPTPLPTPTPPVLTVREYASVVCAKAVPVESTWADVIEFYEGLIKEMEAMQPPDALRRYHRVSIEQYELILEFSQKQPRGETFDPFTLLESPEIEQSAYDARLVLDTLEDSVTAKMAVVGCVV